MKKLMSLYCLFFSFQLMAQMNQFQAGTAIPEYGKIAEVKGMVPIAKDAHFKVSFDVAKPATIGEVNRSLDSVARFINMHVAAGVAIDNITLAVVIHGGAVKEMTVEDVNSKTNAIKNANTPLIQALQSKGVQFYICGQSAAYHGVKSENLLPGIKMSLSAMTAHAQLQQAGFTINPF